MATLVELETSLTQYLAAESAILIGGQEYFIGDKRFRRGDLAVIQKQIGVLRVAIARLSGSSTTYARFSTR
jgi:hypothetical protein